MKKKQNLPTEAAKQLQKHKIGAAASITLFGVSLVAILASILFVPAAIVVAIFLSLGSAASFGANISDYNKILMDYSYIENESKPDNEANNVTNQNAQSQTKVSQEQANVSRSSIYLSRPKKYNTMYEDNVKEDNNETNQL